MDLSVFKFSWRRCRKRFVADIQFFSSLDKDLKNKMLYIYQSYLYNISIADKIKNNAKMN